MKYLIPTTGDMTTLTDILTRAQVELISPANAREYILEDKLEKIVVFAVDDKILRLLQVNAGQLLVDLPIRLLGVPGLIYSPDWMMASTHYPVGDFEQLKDQLKQSGHTANSVERLDEVDRQAQSSSVPDVTLSSFRRNRKTDDSELANHEVEDSGIVDATDLPGV